MVTWMDRLLKLENLDLHLTPYRVLATGNDEGMLEFIPSSSLAQVSTIRKTFTQVVVLIIFIFSKFILEATCKHIVTLVIVKWIVSRF